MNHAPSLRPALDGPKSHASHQPACGWVPYSQPTSWISRVSTPSLPLWPNRRQQHQFGQAGSSSGSSVAPLVSTVKHLLARLGTLGACLRFGCKCAIRALDQLAMATDSPTARSFRASGSTRLQGSISKCWSSVWPYTAMPRPFQCRSFKRIKQDRAKVICSRNREH